MGCSSIPRNCTVQPVSHACQVAHAIANAPLLLYPTKAVQFLEKRYLHQRSQQCILIQVYLLMLFLHHSTVATLATLAAMQMRQPECLAESRRSRWCAGLGGMRRRRPASCGSA